MMDDCPWENAKNERSTYTSTKLNHMAAPVKGEWRMYLILLPLLTPTPKYFASVRNLNSSGMKCPLKFLAVSGKKRE